MIDLFNVIQSTQSEYNVNNTHLIVKQILNVIDISKLNINWPVYLHAFYTDKMHFNDDIIKQILKCIMLILINENDTIIDENNTIIDENNIIKYENNINKLNHLNRFIHLNSLFVILNDLNITHNQMYNNNNYTLNMCQDYYISYITSHKYNILIDHWFNGIFNNIFYNLVDNNKSKYNNGIKILKNYLVHASNIYINNDKREELIAKFINKYSNWSSIYLNNKYNENKLTLIEVFEIFNKINKLNESFIELNDCKIYKHQTIINMISCWENYLINILEDDLEIDNIIINNYNLINLSNTLYYDIIIKFCEKWQNQIKLKINLNNYRNSQLFESLNKICPLIINFNSGQNKSDIIIKYFADIYNFEPNLIEYIIIGFNILIKNLYNLYYQDKSAKLTTLSFKLNPKIINILTLISLYENKEMMWKLYIIAINQRIRILTKKYNIDINIINFEKYMINFLINNGCITFSDKSKTLISNYTSSINHINNIHKCKINYVNDQGIKKEHSNEWYMPNIKNMDIIVIDKYINEVINEGINEDINKYTLIDPMKFPNEIKTYLSVGKTYYDIISETKILQWNIENSIINFNIGDHNIISNIIQYTLIYHIINQQMTQIDLINHVINTTLNIDDHNNAIIYINSYISNILVKNIFKLSNNLLIFDNLYLKSISNIHNKIIDISNFIPSLNDLVSISIPEIKTKIDLENECILYLRIILIAKMFKTNSDKIYSIENIIELFNIYINNYIESNNFNNNLINNIKLLLNIDNKQLLYVLSYLEKRDIIEKITKNLLTGYIYVL